MNREERMLKLLERSLEVCSDTEYTPLAAYTVLANDIEDFLDEQEEEEIKYNFDIVLAGLKPKYFKEEIKKRDKIEFVKNYGYQSFIKPFIEKYWNNMDKLFDKLEKIYLEEGEKDNE